jgi:hypothetical protein
MTSRSPLLQEAVRERVADAGPPWVPKPVDELDGISDFQRGTRPERLELTSVRRR